MSMPQESVFSVAPRFEGNVVEMLLPGKAMSETANLRGKRFEWLGLAEKGIAEEERLNTVNRAPGLCQANVSSSKNANSET